MSISIPLTDAGDVATATPMVDVIDALLPQTQCTKCGYSGCRPYAHAIAGGDADISQCPPGGAAGIAKLAQLLHRSPRPLNPANGAEQPLRVAAIDEARCIGCTLCIDACPVDAIVGAAKRMHTVLPSLCTGCDLCVAPCPVDCIVMLPVAPPRQWSADDASAARARFDARNARLQRARGEREVGLANRSRHLASVLVAAEYANSSAPRHGALDLMHQATNQAANQAANQATNQAANQATNQAANQATRPSTSAIQDTNRVAVQTAIQAAQQRARERRARFAYAAGIAPGEPEPKS